MCKEKARHSRPSVGLGVASILSSHDEFRSKKSLNKVLGGRKKYVHSGQEIQALAYAQRVTPESSLYLDPYRVQFHSDEQDCELCTKQ